MLDTPSAAFRIFVWCFVLAASPALGVQEFVRVEGSSQFVADEITGLAIPVRTHGFWIARHEVTQAEFTQVMGRNPSRYQGEHRPVENVSWRDAVEYCNRRSRKEGLTICYEEGDTQRRACTGYRLPTENEWLLAAGADANGNLPETHLRGAVLYEGENTVDALRARALAGTRPIVESDQRGAKIADVVGNVWEWCGDRFNAVRILDSVWDPRGPQTGHERVIRGGSFLSRAREWNKGFRSSMPPDATSAYVGFRLARNLGGGEREENPPEMAPPGAPSIRPFHSASASSAPDEEAIRARWLRVLGEPSVTASAVAAKVIERIQEPAWSARLLELTVEPGQPWRALMVLPAHIAPVHLPTLVIPYYDVDTPAGKNLGGRNSLPPGVRAFAHVAAQYGIASVVVRWSGENDAPDYYEMVADLAQRHPGVTGLGYWAWQARRLTDWLVQRPEVDAERIGIIGHSLGGKMALYAAAFEPRLRAVVSSEPGIAFAFSNYGDPWYFGERLAMLPEGTDQHELLQLIAPRPFLLIAGESADGEKSVPVLEKAAPAYKALGGSGALAILNHGKGHSPTPEAVVEAFEWLSNKWMSDSRQPQDNQSK